MKVITKYVADDGSEWRDAEQAAARDLLIDRVDTIMSQLARPPGDTSYSNGSGYVQQDPELVQKVRVELLTLAAKTNPYWADKFEQSKNPDIHLSWALRLMEGEPRPLERALNRLYCTDKHSREWGQPFYADHPEQGTQRRLNP